MNSNVLTVKEITPNYLEEAKRRYNEAKVLKQKAKDEKDFEKIRKKLMNKIFANYQEDVVESQKTVDEFVEYIKNHEEKEGESSDKIKNAKGALGAEESAKYSKKMGKLTLANMVGTSTSTVISTLISGGVITESFATAVLQCLSPASALGYMSTFFVPPMIGPLVGVAATVLTGLASFIINKKFSKQANVGLSADAVEKMKDAVKKWDETCKKLQELNQMVLSDKEKLIGLLRSKGKKDFDKELDNYLFKTLAPKIKALGLDLSFSEEMKKEFLNLEVSGLKKDNDKNKLVNCVEEETIQK